MPRYDYGCKECGHEWEETRPIDRRHDPAECPICKGPGSLVFRSAPTIPWCPWTTKSPFKEKRRHH